MTTEHHQQHATRHKDSGNNAASELLLLCCMLSADCSDEAHIGASLTARASGEDSACRCSSSVGFG